MVEPNRNSETDSSEHLDSAHDRDGEPSGGTQQNRLARFSGIWKDNPDLDEFRKNVEEFRRQVNEVES